MAHLKKEMWISYFRYFYTHTNVDRNVRYCDSALATIQRRTLRDVLCDNLNLDKLQLNVFKLASDDTNPVMPCGKINRDQILENLFC